MPGVAGKEAEGLAQRKAARMEPDGEEAGKSSLGANEEKGLFSRTSIMERQDSVFDASCTPLKVCDSIHRTRRKGRS